jgi:CHAD domain-containing protein
MQTAHQRYRDELTPNACTTSISVYLRHSVAVLHHRLRQTAAVLTHAPSPAAVHDTRVAARRIRVLLRTYQRQFDTEEAKRYKRHLKDLIRDLAAAREAYVARHSIMQLGGNRLGRIGIKSRALYERAVKRYASALDGLRLTIAGAPWRQRLRDLGRLSAASSLVKESDDSAATVMQRLVKRRRRRLRARLSESGTSSKHLHRLRLRVKAMRYTLEGCLSKSANANSSEIKRLRQMQNCLGEMHDEEMLLKALRAEQKHREGARNICKKLKARKSRQLHAFKGYRKGLMWLWGEI